MNYSTHLACLYCDQPVSRTAAKQHTCPSCWSTMTAEYGPEWYTQPWHTELLPDYVKFTHDSRTMNQTLSIENDNIDFSDQDIVQPSEVRPVRYHNVYEAVYRLHVTKNLGGRQIKRELERLAVKPEVSLRTVMRYLATAKRAASDAQVLH